MAYEMPQDPFANTRPCWHSMPNNYDPITEWSGTLYCELYPHDRNTSHTALTPSGNPRVWRDHHGTHYPSGY